MLWYVCMYVCMYVYAYIYTYIHIHIYIYTHIVLLMWPVDKSGCSIQSKDVVPTSGRSLQMQANYEPEADEPAAKKSKVSDWAAKFEVNHLDDSNTSVIVCEAYPALQISNLCLLFCNKIPSSDCCRSWFTPFKLLWRWLAGLGGSRAGPLGWEPIGVSHCQRFEPHGTNSEKLWETLDAGMLCAVPMKKCFTWEEYCFGCDIGAAVTAGRRKDIAPSFRYSCMQPIWLKDNDMLHFRV